MDSPKPLVSVIVPVYNGSKYLSQALESILSQDLKKLEIIVVDDGSTDSSAQIAKLYPVRYYHRVHSGLSATLNHGISLAKGDFFSFSDQDDLWIKTKLSMQMAIFDKYPTLDMVFGRVRQFRDTEVGKSDNRNLIKGSLMKGTMLIRRESFYRVGPFNTKWTLGEFIDWYLRAHDLGLKSYTLPNILYKRRIHTTNMGITFRRKRKDYVHILKESLDRRKI